MLLNTIISDLIPIDPSTVTEEVVVKGYSLTKDGGGGTFYWDPGSTTAANGGTVFASTFPGANGRWVRIYSGPLNVRWFGAKGDGTTDDTTAVHSARNAAISGTIYFPAGIYIGSFQVSLCNILGDGYDSVLKSNGTSTGGVPNPVLRLGYRPSSHWSFNTVSHIKVDGNYSGSRFTNGIVYDDATSTELSGRWILEEVEVTGCLIGIYKPNGNIGNTYNNCSISKNDIGYYSKELLNTMHSGCERFTGGHIEKNDKAGVVVTATQLYGQLVFDGTVIEQNKGFGVLIKLTSYASMTFSAVDFRNVWLEANATSTVSVTIDSVTYATTDLRNFRFEGVRTVSFYDSLVRDITLIGSSVNLYNCRSDDSYFGPAIVEVDSESSMVAQEMRNAKVVSENIFVNSLSYDATTDWGLNELTSVWGPLRSTLVSGPVANGVSKRYDGTNPYVMWSPGASYTTQVPGGVHGVNCAEISLLSGVLSTDSIAYVPVDGKYYFWSIHTSLDSGDATGHIMASNNKVFGQIVMKPGQWTCSYGIKKYVQGTTAPTELWVGFNAVTNCTIRFADFQLLEFDTLAEAQAFANSRAFAVQEPAFTQVRAYARTWYDSSVGSWVFLAAYNFATIVRNSVGNFTLTFTDPMTRMYVTNLTAVGNGYNVYVASETFNDVTVIILDAAGNPVDERFNITIF